MHVFSHGGLGGALQKIIAFVTAVGLLAGLMGPAPLAYAAVPGLPSACPGVIGDYNVIEATGASVSGTNGKDFIYAGNNNTTAIQGGNQNDCILVGNNNTATVSGGNGNDVIIIGDNNTGVVFGNNGNDTIEVGDNNTGDLSGGNENDTIRGGDGAYDISGDNGADTCEYGTGAIVVSASCETSTGPEPEEPGTLVVIKKVVNDNGGSADPGNFTIEVEGTNVSDDSFAGADEPGVTVTLDAGAYRITEPTHPDYTVSYSNDCEGTIAAGATKTCTITNDDDPARLTIAKAAAGGDDTFEFQVSGSDEFNASRSIETSGGTGTAEVLLLDAGTYRIEETDLPAGWDFSDATCVYEGGDDVDIDNGDDISVEIGDVVTCTFENAKRASFSLTKFASPSVGEFQFDLEGPDQEDMPATRTFRPDGEWTIENLLPGDYTLTETILAPEDWSGSQDVVCTGGSNPTGSVDGNGFDFTLAPGDALSCVVNNTQDAAVSGRVFEDVDGAGEGTTGTGVSGWAVSFTLQGEGGGTEEVMTDADGNYSVLLPPGSYHVCAEQRTGWFQSYPDGSAEDVASCEGSQGYLIDVEAGSNTNGIDFGNYRTGTIAGTKWHDKDADGLIDSDDESGLSGWTIQLLRGDSLVAEEVTAGGTFQFGDVAPGEYTLREVLQEGWAQAFPASGEHAVTAVSNGTVVDKNFGNVEDATISGSKWEDANGNGAKDEGESGLSGWTIYADLDEDGSLDSAEPRATTDADGEYTITGLLPGAYVVREVMQSGWAQTFPEAGYHSVTLAIDEDVADIDFGNAEAVTLTGTKWHDEDADGRKDKSESGIEGWTIVATPITEDGEEDGQRSVRETVTEEGGDYEFNFLASDFGWWRISEEQQLGWTQTAPTLPAYYDVLVSDEGPGEEAEGSAAGFDPEEGVYEYYDFGNWENPTLRVLKWNDANSDGVRNWDDSEGDDLGVHEEGERFTEDVVEEWPIALGRVVAEDEGGMQVEVIAVQSTDDDGLAEILVPAPGEYVVLEGQDRRWERIYPGDRTTPTLTVTFASGVSTIDLDTDSFFDISIDADMHGDLIEEGRLPAEEGSEEEVEESALQFGNHVTGASEEDGGRRILGGGSAPLGPASGGQVLGEATTTPSDGTPSVLGSFCELPLTSYLRRGRVNDSVAVSQLQMFLNEELDLVPPLPVTGFFGPLTEAAVRQFQLKYSEDILKPWVDLGLLPANSPTGIVYKTTLWKIQSLGCPDLQVSKPILP